MTVWVPPKGLLVYPKPLRLPLGPKRIPAKEYMRENDLKYLLSGRVLVEEKMDGKTFPFNAGEFVVFAEDLKLRHSVFYKVPARFAVFDIFDAKRGVMLSNEGKREVFSHLKRNPSALPHEAAASGIFFVPLLEKGRFSAEELPALIRASAYAYDEASDKNAFMEGIVVKPDRELFLEEHLSGKLVREEFLEGITENYLAMEKRHNQINPAFENAKGALPQSSP